MRYRESIRISWIAKREREGDTERVLGYHGGRERDRERVLRHLGGTERERGRERQIQRGYIGGGGGGGREGGFLEDELCANLLSKF